MKSIEWRSIGFHSINSTSDRSEVLAPQIAPPSRLLLPKLSTLVDCCLQWVAQHLQAFCMLLAAHCHHIVVVPLWSSNCRCPIAILETPLLLSLTSSPLAAAAESSPLPSPSPSLPLSPPLLLLPSSLTLLQQRCFVIVVSSCFLVANWRSWTKPLLPKLSTMVDCCLGWVAQHLQAFCMSLPPITITSSSSHHCCQIAVVQLPSLNFCHCRHRHCLNQQRRRHHCYRCCRPRRRLTHCHRCRHCRCWFVNVASSLLLKWGGASLLCTYPMYSYVGYLARPLVVCGNSVFGDHDTPHRRPTNAKFDNKPLMKKGQNKRGVLQTWTIMAIHWGLPAHDSNPQFFGSTGGTQFSTIYSIQYGCLGCQNY